MIRLYDSPKNRQTCLLFNTVTISSPLFEKLSVHSQCNHHDHVDTAASMAETRCGS